MIYTGGYLGPRRGELAALRRKDFNPLMATLAIRGTLRRDERPLHYVAATKTSADRRTLSVPSILVDILNDHLSGHSSEWMLPTRTGDHVRSYASWMNNYWRSAVQRSGIDYATPHALRHGAAAIMIDLGANPVTIQH